MEIKERLLKYFREKSPFRITTDLLFYLLILSLLLPVSRRYVATGLNRLMMHRPAVIDESRQVTLGPADFEWELADSEGRMVSFEDFRGELIFLSLWATWCPPCRAEMPNIQRLYDAYGDRVAFVLASQEDPSVVRKFFQDQGHDLPFYTLIRNLPDQLQTTSIPTTYLITRDGRIAVRKTGAARWDGAYFTNYLDRLLSE
jgi:thiol-disulfide isomerase/thioredoxin